MPTNYELNSNKFDFYSGAQITVWFGDIMLDDINTIQWIRTQSKRPIYGYASQHFDAVARGTVMIQGSFTINFRQSGYLTAVTSNIRKIYKAYSGETQSGDAVYDQAQWSSVRNLISLHLQNGTFGPQTSQEIIDLGNSPDFFATAKLYEDAIWQDRENMIDTYSDPSMVPPDIAQSDLIPNGFNILVTYGNTSHVGAVSFEDRMQSTTKTLVGVHLVGESQMIQVGGQPVQEQYSFIARDTDSFVGYNR